MSEARHGLLGAYLSVLRDEPKARAYLLGAFVDDVGVAVSAWASQLLMVSLFTDQRERAKLMLPSLACFLVGTLVAGPLADWVSRGSRAELARWRWKVVVWGRIVETVALGLLIRGVAGKPTISSVLPYVMVSAFMKTALRPTRIAFSVDLLAKERAQVDPTGAPIMDEQGAPLMYKTHLLTFGAMTSFLRTAAVLGGLLLGGRILAVASGRYVPLYLIDVGTNLLFVAVIFFGCHPDRGAGAARLRDLLREREPLTHLGERAVAAARSSAMEAVVEIFASFRDAARYLVKPEQRPLLILLSGGLATELMSEFYDGKMIIKHVLRGSDDAVRYADISWVLVSMAAAALIPALARRVSSLGKIFLVVMLVDGAMIALAGASAAAGLRALMPFALFLGADTALTTTSGSLVELAQNSASSAALRGRIAAFYGFVVIVADIFAEIGATALSEAVGIPGMLVRVGLGQAAFVAILAVVGGRSLWSYGLRTKTVGA